MISHAGTGQALPPDLSRHVPRLFRETSFRFDECISTSPHLHHALEDQEHLPARNSPGPGSRHLCSDRLPCGRPSSASAGFAQALACPIPVWALQFAVQITHRRAPLASP